MFSFFSFVRKYSKRIYAAKESIQAYVTPRYIAKERLPRSKYGGRYLVTMIPGDSTGKELMAYVQDILRMLCTPIDFEIIDCVHAHDVKHAVRSARRNHVALKGNMELDNVYGDKNLYVDSPNVNLRKKLNLYTYVAEFKTFDKVACKFPHVDIVLVRQNTEGEYSMLEHATRKGVVNSLKIVTRENARKTAEYAVDYARARDRNLITIVHKADDMPLGDGLFLDVCRRVGRENGVAMNDMRVNNACMALVTNPYQFDVILCPNLYGNVMTNIICGLIAGSGCVAASNIGSDCAVFEPACRNKAVYLPGENVANPTSFLHAAANMLDHLGFQKRSMVIRQAVQMTIARDGMLTEDLGGKCRTTEFVERMKANIKELLCDRDYVTLQCAHFCGDRGDDAIQFQPVDDPYDKKRYGWNKYLR